MEQEISDKNVYSISLQTQSIHITAYFQEKKGILKLALFFSTSINSVLFEADERKRAFIQSPAEKGGKGKNLSSTSGVVQWEEHKDEYYA